MKIRLDFACKFSYFPEMVEIFYGDGVMTDGSVGTAERVCLRRALSRLLGLRV
jgi:hypothetical protein